MGEECGDDNIGLPSSGIPFELPEITTVCEEDPRYIPHLDDSMAALDSMISTWMDRMDNAENGFNPNACASWTPAYAPNKGSLVKRLTQELGQIVERKEDFIAAALGLTELHTLYDPDTPSRYVHMLFEGRDGRFEYRQLDLREKNVTSFQVDGDWPALQTIQSEEWLSSFLSQFGDSAVYIVCCPAKQVLVDDLTGHACIVVDAFMSKRYPEFYKANGMNPVPSQVVEIDIMDCEKDGEGNIVVKSARKMHVGPHKNRLTYEAAARPFSEGDHRLN